MANTLRKNGKDVAEIVAMRPRQVAITNAIVPGLYLEVDRFIDIAGDYEIAYANGSTRKIVIARMDGKCGPGGAHIAISAIPN